MLYSPAIQGSTSLRHFDIGVFKIPSDRRFTLITQQVLQHPALGILGQLIPEFDIARQCVLGHYINGPMEQLFLCQGSTGLQNGSDLYIILSLV